MAVFFCFACVGLLAGPLQGGGQAKGGSQGKSEAAQAKKTVKKQATQKGQPEEKGVEHAAETANPQGAEHGIGNAQEKQAAKDTKATAKESNKRSKGKHEAIRRDR